MTMYSNKLAVCVKAAGKVLREYDTDKVYLPFQSEYSIFIKNLNSVRALVKVEIDGVDVSDGRNFALGGLLGNNTLEIERFIKNSNLQEGNRFKFIERNDKVEKSRGIKAEDGLIRVEFQFEKVLQKYNTTTFVETYPYPPSKVWYGSGTIRSAGLGGGTFSSASSAGVDEPFVAYASAGMSFNDAGITVPGSLSTQQFSEAAWFPTEDTKHVVIFKLLGIGAKGKVQKPITVSAKPKCSTCGHINKATSKFCAECGTSLIIV